MTIVVVTGMSGAGKTTAMHALEDAGFHTVDNLPPSLWAELAHAVEAVGTTLLAIGVDVRTASFLGDAPDALAALEAAGHVLDVVFLDARDEALVRRYSFTRRTHPLGRGMLSDDLEAERRSLEPLRSRADRIIDTTSLTAKDLQARMQHLSGGDGFELRLVSFGYKRGVPTDVDAVLDVRSLRNPYWDEALRPLPGLDRRVQEYVFADGGLDAYAPMRDMVRQLAEGARRTGRSGYTVALGCTGGQHRSVAVVERLARDLADGFAAVTVHRDLDEALAEHAPTPSAPHDGDEGAA